MDITTPQYKTPPEAAHSPQINELVRALAAAQKEFRPIKKSAVNPFFNSKYATLDIVIDAVKDALSDNGLAVSQLPTNGELKTLLMHSSGQWIMSITPLHAEKRGPQGYGSALTYGRRYALSAILNVSSEEDDDGHVAQHQKVVETSLPKQYGELMLKADSAEKWDKLGEWLKKNKASKKLYKQYEEDYTMWKENNPDDGEEVEPHPAMEE